MGSLHFTDADRDERGFIRITPPERTLADLLPAPSGEAGAPARPAIPARAQLAGGVVLMLVAVFVAALFLGSRGETVAPPEATRVPQAVISEPAAPTALPTIAPTAAPTALPAATPTVALPTPEPIIIYQEAPPAPTQCATVSGGGVTVQRCGSLPLDQLDADARNEWKTQFDAIGGH